MAEPPPTPPAAPGELDISAAPSPQPNMAQQDSDLMPPAATGNLHTSATEEEVDRLPELVQSLPAELFNDILEYTLTPEPPGDVVIDKKYRPPIHLQIDRKSREKFAAKYYNTTTFVTTEDTGPELSKWLKSLPRLHLKSIGRLHMYVEPRKTSSCPEFQATYCRRLVGSLDAYLKRMVLQFALVELESHRSGFLTVSYWPRENGAVGAEMRVTWDETLRLSGITGANA